MFDFYFDGVLMGVSIEFQTGICNNKPNTKRRGRVERTIEATKSIKVLFTRELNWQAHLREFLLTCHSGRSGNRLAKSSNITRALLLVARKLLGAPGRTTSSKKLLGAKGVTTRGSWPYGATSPSK